MHFGARESGRCLRAEPARISTLEESISPPMPTLYSRGNAPQMRWTALSLRLVSRARETGTFTGSPRFCRVSQRATRDWAGFEDPSRVEKSQSQKDAYAVGNRRL